MRYVWLGFLFVVVAAVSVLGFRGSLFQSPPIEVFPDMDRQPKYKPQSQSRFFPNGMTDRPLPANVVPRGRHVAADATYLAADEHMYRGYRGPLLTQGTDWYQGFPTGVDFSQQLLARGGERYTVFCAPCHGRLGDGNGITKQYGMNPATLLDDRIRQMAEGELFNTISNGKNTMLGYGDRVSVADRWAIIAYVRALQRAAQGSVEDVPAANRAELQL